MRVKAKCNIIYKGVLYRSGQEFEADSALPNTEPTNEVVTDAGEAPAEVAEPTAKKGGGKRAKS